MKKVMMVGCGAYMDSGYGCAAYGPDYAGKPSVRGEHPPPPANPHGICIYPCQTPLLIPNFSRTVPFYIIFPSSKTPLLSFFKL